MRANLLLCAAILAIDVSVSAATFRDDFNRSNGKVHNGWLDYSDHLGGKLSLVNGDLTNNFDNSVAGIFRYFSFSESINVDFSFSETNGYYGRGGLYENRLIFGTNGDFRSGFGIGVTRSGYEYDDSHIQLLLGERVVEISASTFQFSEKIEGSFSLSTDGVIAGRVWDDENSFDFKFLAPAAVKTTTSFGIEIGGADGRLFPNGPTPGMQFVSLESATLSLPPVISSLPPTLAPSPIRIQGNIRNFDNSKPTVVITHGWQPGETDDPLWVTRMGADIRKALPDSSDVNIIEAYWDGAKTHGPTPSELRSAAAQVGYQGAVLAAHLRGLSDSFEAGIQFIGHSLGSHVNAYATRSLTDGGYNVDQFTILDRPFGTGVPVDSIFPIGGDVDGDMFRTLLVRGGVTWVDNYYGNDAYFPPAVGAKFRPEVTALNVLYDGADHSDVHERYKATIGTLEPCGSGGGFACSIAIASQLRLEEEKWNPGVVRRRPSGDPVIIDPIDWLTFNCIINNFAHSADCTEGSPAFLWKEDFVLAAGSEYLTFDFKWISLGDGDWMSVFFDDTLLYQFMGTAFSGSDYLNSGIIPIHDLAGRTGRLVFALSSVGDANANFSIKNILIFSTEGAAAIPEPGNWTMMIAGFGLIGASLRVRRRKEHSGLDFGIAAGSL